jgi:hypothetical protein
MSTARRCIWMAAVCLLLFFMSTGLWPAQASANNDYPGYLLPPNPVEMYLDGTMGSVGDWYRLYALPLRAGDTFVAALTTQTAGARMVLYAGNFSGGVASSRVLSGGTTAQALGYVVPRTGVYSLSVGNVSGTAGPETLRWAVSPSPAWQTPTSISINTNATSTNIGRTPILSGTVSARELYGCIIVVYVKKPGKSYWTYSSNRVVYDRYQVPSWQYKYYFKRGMAKGVYTFKASVPTYPGYPGSVSPNTVSIRLR